ncbi:MAG TPA: C40 family peptidase [Chitinophagaceae bacterium]|nr:C40 family peptidase [Chitinophagaceae bacterium]
MNYGMVSVPAAPMRKKPNHRRQMVSQLLFGESVMILEKRGKWIRVRGLHDEYSGWMTRSLVMPVTERDARPDAGVVSGALLNLLVLNGQAMHIPFGSSLPHFENGRGGFPGLQYEFSGQHIDRHAHRDGALLRYAESWLNVPYLWGGRTPLGVDCSGFVQIMHKMIGIDLPRDAWQQAQTGKKIKKLKDAAPGDLAFFDDRDEIVHVGILLGPGQIIHASGTVRVDPIDTKGIVHAGTGKRTHRLRLIRRVN